MTGTPWELTLWLHDQPADKAFECREVKARRSLTQNAYYWALLNRLARALSMPDSEVHRHMLREYGTADVFTVRDDVPLEGYFPYFDVIGRGTMNGREYSHVRAYKRSSAMDSAEFARLLSGMVEECEAQGIATMTREEISRLEWIEGK